MVSISGWVEPPGSGGAAGGGVSAVADFAQGPAAGVAAQGVDVEAAVEVVGFVLEGAGEESAAGDGGGFAVLVDAVGGGVHGAGGREVQLGDGQAAFVVVLELGGEFEGGVDEVASVSVGVVDEDAGADADLGCGDAGSAGGAEEGVHQVGDQDA